MHKKKGFTLVEFLVVISIMVFSVSVIMPTLQKVRKQSHMAVCRSNLKQLAIAGHIYASDNKGKFWIGPYGVDPGANGATIGGVFYSGPSRTWNVALLPYFKDRQVMCCPEAPQNRPHSDSAGGSIFPLPHASWKNGDGMARLWYGAANDIASYGENMWLCDVPTGAWWLGSGGIYKDYFFRKVSKLATSHNVPMLFDSLYPSVKPLSTDAPPAIPEIITSQSMTDIMTLRHEGQMNAAFADLSVRQAGLKDAWWFKWHAQWNLQRVPVWPDWMNALPNQHAGN